MKALQLRTEIRQAVDDLPESVLPDLFVRYNNAMQIKWV